MKKLVDDPRLIYKCCDLYYRQEKSQQEICDLFGVSRPSVSRMLKSGRELGIVRIEIVNPDATAYGQLERQLEDAFSLKEAIVVCDSPSQSGAETGCGALGSAALSYLARVLHNGDYVGISMGWTLLQTIKAECGNLEPVHCTFIPLVGGIGEGSETHANFLTRRFGGERLQLYSPAIFTDPAVLAGFRREGAVRPVFDLYDRLDAAVFGIGILDSSQSTAVRLNYVDVHTLEAFSAAGAVGDISLQYFNRDGQTAPYESYNERVAGLQLQELKQVPRRIAIAGGRSKIKAVLGALRGGFINVLITDESCARGIAACINEEEE